MAAVDLTVGVGGQVSELGLGKAFVQPIEIDFSVNNVAASDVITVWDVPDKILILQVYWSVITAETGNFDVGDIGDNNGYVAAASAASVADGMGAGLLLIDAGSDYTGGNFNGAADSIIVVPDAAMDSGKIRLQVYGINFGDWTTT